MNKEELQKAYDELKEQHEHLVSEHEELLNQVDQEHPDFTKVIDSATRQIRGECEAEVKVAHETNATLLAENETLKQESELARSKRKGAKIVAVGVDPFAGSGIEKGDIVATVTLERGLTFTQLTEAGYFGRVGVHREPETGGEGS